MTSMPSDTVRFSDFVHQLAEDAQKYATQADSSKYDPKNLEAIDARLQEAISKTKSGQEGMKKDLLALSTGVKNLLSIVKGGEGSLDEVKSRISSISTKLLASTSEKEQKVEAEKAAPSKAASKASRIPPWVVGIFQAMDQITPMPAYWAIRSGYNIYDDVPCPTGNNVSVRIGDHQHVLHANIVKGIDGRNFVASQMPFRPASQEVFWKAIFSPENNIHNIMDLSNPEDLKKSVEEGLLSIKLAKETPTYPRGPCQFGSMKVTPEGEPKPDAHGFLIHTYKVEDVSRPDLPAKIITRTRFAGWPDGAPIPLDKLIPLVDHIDALSSKEKPLVHCRMGVGRTGTLIACALLKQHKNELRKDPEGLIVDVMRIILQARRERGPRFVQQPEQFESVLQYAQHLTGTKLSLSPEAVKRVMGLLPVLTVEVYSKPEGRALGDRKVEAEAEIKIKASEAKPRKPAGIQYLYGDKPAGGRLLADKPVGTYYIATQPKARKEDWFHLVYKGQDPGDKEPRVIGTQVRFFKGAYQRFDGDLFKEYDRFEDIIDDIAASKFGLANPNPLSEQDKVPPSERPA